MTTNNNTAKNVNTENTAKKSTAKKGENTMKTTEKKTAAAITVNTVYNYLNSLYLVKSIEGDTVNTVCAVDKAPHSYLVDKFTAKAVKVDFEQATINALFTAAVKPVKERKERKAKSAEDKAATHAAYIERVNSNVKRITDILEGYKVAAVDGRTNDGYKRYAKNGEQTNRISVKRGHGFSFEMHCKDNGISVFCNRGQLDILKAAYVPFECVKAGLTGHVDMHIFIEQASEKAAIKALLNATTAAVRTRDTSGYSYTAAQVKEDKTAAKSAKTAAK